MYAVFDYTAQQPDELSFKAGQQLTILRKGDESEREWWWSRIGDSEGYVPRNLLGVSFWLVVAKIRILQKIVEYKSYRALNCLQFQGNSLLYDE